VRTLLVFLIEEFYELVAQSGAGVGELGGHSLIWSIQVCAAEQGMVADSEGRKMKNFCLKTGSGIGSLSIDARQPKVSLFLF